MKKIALALVATTTLLATPALSDTARQSAEASARLNAASTLALAQNRTYLDVVAGLEAEGYVIRDIQTTWLGRIKILAASRANLREVVVSRTTGEIMSDVIIEVFARGKGNATTGADGGSHAGASGGLDLGVDVDVDLDADLKLGGSRASGSGSGGISLGIGN